jgi:drug/metabolite transporter (DMT)-like permease
MILLTGSILLSAFLAIAFKICEKLGINKFQAIVFNYLTCVITGCLVNDAIPVYSLYLSEPWFTWALIMGVGFVVSFNLIALTVQKNGLAVAAVSSKLSLVIPFVASLFLYGEEASVVKVAGIVLALLAVLFTLYPSGPIGMGEKAEGTNLFVLPLVVFVATGLLDSLVKYVEQHFINEANNDEYLVTAFTVAFLAGVIFLIAGLVARKIKFQPKAIFAGVLIGIPNYFSIWCLMKVLKMYARHSSVIIPVTNMGIVLVGALVAGFVFKEHLKRINWVGIVLSIVAICMIAFG